MNTFAAERSLDLVLVVDATSDVGEVGSTTVDHALRGALGVARTYLDARDRVGMVFFGERMRWLAPGMGDRQFFRLMDAALAGRAGWSSGNDITRLPHAALPPGAAVVAFSPLLDPKFVETLRDLRQRGFSVIVVDVLEVAPTGTRDKLDRLTQRIWRLERQALMFSIQELGITVVSWAGKGELICPSVAAGSPQAPAGEVHRGRSPTRCRLYRLGGHPAARDRSSRRGLAPGGRLLRGCRLGPPRA